MSSPNARDPAAVVPPSLAEIERAREFLAEHLLVTPVLEWRDPWIASRLGRTRVHLKLELFQRTGSFKARGAWLSLSGLDDAQRRRGVTAVSAGNHAIAVAWAAAQLGTHAKIVMPRASDPERITTTESLGGQVVLVDDVAQAFAAAERLVGEEGRTLIHPFEGPAVARGTGTLGLELLDQVPELSAVIVPIGGGGLCAGIASAVKQARPRCQVFGVEPEGADTMHRSFAANAPQAIEAVRTIADSLGAPRAEPYSFALCRRFVDALVLVDDPALRDAMRILAQRVRLAVEPAGAAATAALVGPLRERLTNAGDVAVIVCGTNISVERYARWIAAET